MAAPSIEPKVRAASDNVNLLPVDSAETSSALQALLDEKILADDPAAAEAKRKADEQAAADKAAADKVAADAAKAGQTPEQKEAARVAAEQAKVDADEAQKKSDDHVPSLADTVKAEEERIEAERVAKEKAAAPAPKADDAAPKTDAFDAVLPPAGAKSKFTESFDNLKKVAREQVTTITAKLDEQTKLFNEVTEKLKSVEATVANRPAVTPEIEAELTDLRRFRIAHDAESDPEFKKFDAEITRNDERIYKKLADGGIADNSIKQIKELGGLSKVDQEPILSVLPLHIRRTVESILVDSEGIKDKQLEALASAKAKGTEYLTERASREATTVTETANGFLKDLPWTAEKTIPATATPEQKAELEAHNAFARESLTSLKELLSDRSPARFAELAVCTILAQKHKADKLALQAKLTTATADKDKALKELNDKLTAVTTERDAHAAKLLKIKQAELPRGAGAHQTVTTANTKTGILDERSTVDALEALRLEAEAAQNG